MAVVELVCRTSVVDSERMTQEELAELQTRRQVSAPCANMHSDDE